MGVEVYEKLRQHLDRLPLGAPKTADGVEIEFFKCLFTEEEAELATQLTPMPEGINSIAQRTGRDQEELSAKLEVMASKGLIFRIGEKGNRTYNLVPVLPGMYEFQLNRIDPEMARLFDEYYMKALGNEVFGAKTPWMRVVPVEREIPQQMDVFPYEKASEIIKAADVIAVAECICRKEQKLVGGGCDAPADNCLVFSHWANFYIENGMGRKITQEEALQVLNKAEEAGLVHCSNNTELGHFAICNCCGCCCGVLRGITHLHNPQAVARSDFILAVDADACVGCEVCLGRCHVKAIAMEDGVAKLMEDRCIGCGVCIQTCPVEALSLQRKEDRVPPPFKEMGALMMQIAQEKGRI